MTCGGGFEQDPAARPEPDVLDQWFARRHQAWWLESRRLVLLAGAVCCAVFFLESAAGLRVAFANSIDQIGLSSLAHRFDSFYATARWWPDWAFLPVCVAAVLLFRPLAQKYRLPPDIQLAFSKADYYGRLRSRLVAAAYFLVLLVYVPFLLPAPVPVALYRITATNLGYLSLQMTVAAALTAVCAELLVWSFLKRRLVLLHLAEIIVIVLFTTKFVVFHVAWQLDSINAPAAAASLTGFDAALSAFGAPVLPFIAYFLRKASAAIDPRFAEYLTESHQ